MDNELGGQWDTIREDFVSRTSVGGSGLEWVGGDKMGDTQWGLFAGEINKRYSLARH